jgi:hypothetical protein
MMEITGCWRKLHNEELRNLYSLPDITKAIKAKEDAVGGTCSINGRNEKWISNFI